jgi:hypothetical protein
VGRLQVAENITPCRQVFHFSDFKYDNTAPVRSDIHTSQKNQNWGSCVVGDIICVYSEADVKQLRRISIHAKHMLRIIREVDQTIPQPFAVLEIYWGLEANSAQVKSKIHKQKFLTSIKMNIVQL